MSAGLVHSDWRGVALVEHQYGAHGQLLASSQGTRGPWTATIDLEEPRQYQQNKTKKRGEHKNNKGTVSWGRRSGSGADRKARAKRYAKQTLGRRLVSHSRFSAIAFGDSRFLTLPGGAHYHLHYLWGQASVYAEPKQLLSVSHRKRVRRVGHYSDGQAAKAGSHAPLETTVSLGVRSRGLVPVLLCFLLVSVLPDALASGSVFVSDFCHFGKQTLHNKTKKKNYK